MTTILYICRKFETTMYDLIVIGAGAAGLMAAATAARNGKSVLLMEKMEKAGRKIRITGKGRCNLTNARPPEEFAEAIRTNADFFDVAFAEFNNNGRENQNISSVYAFSVLCRWIKEYYLNILLTRSKDHTEAINSAKLCGLEVGYKAYLLAYKLIGLIELCNA